MKAPEAQHFLNYRWLQHSCDAYVHKIEWVSNVALSLTHHTTRSTDNRVPCSWAIGTCKEWKYAYWHTENLIIHSEYESIETVRKFIANDFIRFRYCDIKTDNNTINRTCIAAFNPFHWILVALFVIRSHRMIRTHLYAMPYHILSATNKWSSGECSYRCTDAMPKHSSLWDNVAKCNV